MALQRREETIGSPMARKNMHPEDIKCAIRKTDITLSSLGPLNNLAAASIRQALIHPVPAANRVIADYLGKSLHEIWPEWFAPDGTRLYLKRNIRDKARRRLKAAAS